MSQELKNKVNDLFKGIANTGGRTIDTIKREIEVREEKLESKKIELKRIFDELKSKKIELERIENTNIDFFERIQAVSNNEKIKKVSLDMATEVIYAETIPLFVTATNGAMYKLGRYKIEFSPKTTTTKFLCLDNDCKRTSYWGEKCHHPHVNKTGDACAGNSAEMIAYLASEYEYQALFDILVSFLEQANLDDCAGRHVMNWDKVDPVTKEVVKKGYKNKQYGEFIYDREDHTKDKWKYEEGSEGTRTCPHCHDSFYEDDMRYIDNLDRYVCEDCFEDDYRYCGECGEYHHENDVTYVDSIDDYVCDYCLESKFFYCKSCEGYFRKEQLHIDEHEQEVCRSCYES